MIYLCDLYSVFFFKQKTAYEMRISDWSSDVCSSDLRAPPPRREHEQHDAQDPQRDQRAGRRILDDQGAAAERRHSHRDEPGGGARPSDSAGHEEVGPEPPEPEAPEGHQEESELGCEPTLHVAGPPGVQCPAPSDRRCAATARRGARQTHCPER